MDRIRQPARLQITPPEFPLEAAQPLSAQSDIGSFRQRLREVQAPVYEGRVLRETH